MADINPIGARATAEAPNTSRGRPEVTKLASLKQLAQQHLGEIDDMTRKERLEEEKRKAELDDEAKRKERRQRKQQPTAQEESHGRKGRMRTAQGIVSPQYH